jgi:PAS domain S-box-containing protein
VLHGLPSAVVLTTCDGVVTYANRAAERLLEMDAREIVGQPVDWNLERPNERHRGAGLLEAISANGSWSGELLLGERRGRCVGLRATSSVLRDDEGAPVAIMHVVEGLTSENRAEGALGEALEQFRALANCVPALVTITWDDGRPRWFNEAFFEYTGATYDELVASGWRSLVHPEDLERVPAPVVRTPWLAEFRFRRQDGEYRWMSVRTADVRNARGEVIGFVGVAFDIHEMRTAEERAEAARRELEAVYQSAPTGLAVIDADRRIVRVSQALADWNGVPVEDHIGRKPDEILGRSPRVTAALDKVLGEGVPVIGLELYGATPGTAPEKRHWLENWMPLKDPAGRVTGASVAVEDVTDRRRSETREREAKEDLEAMLDALPASVVVLDEGSIVTFNNCRWIQTTGIDLRGRHVRDLLSGVHPDDLEATRLAWRAALHGRQPMEGTFRLLQQDGSYRWQLARGAPIATREGYQPQYIGSIVDIDEQQRTSEALAVAGRIKDDLFGMVSHEIRAPLATILGLSDMLRRRVAELDQETRRQALDQLFDDAGRLSDLIEGMLVLSRAERTAPDLEPVLLQRTLPTVFALTAQHHNSVRWEIQLPETLPPVVGKPGWIEQVAANLASNAIKYSGPRPADPGGDTGRGRSWSFASSTGGEESRRRRLSGSSRRFTGTRMQRRRSRGSAWGWRCAAGSCN